MLMPTIKHNLGVHANYDVSQSKNWLTLKHQDNNNYEVLSISGALW